MTPIPRTKPVYLHQGDVRQLETHITSCRPVSALAEADRELFKAVISPPSQQQQQQQHQHETHVVTTAETIFHPKGGGQPSDTGVIQASVADGGDASAVFQVELVRKTLDSQILHAGRFVAGFPLDKDGSNGSNGSSGSSSSSSGNGCQTGVFAAGQPVRQAVDSDTRDYHSRLHTAGHIIDLAVEQLEKAGAIAGLTKHKANHAPGAACVEWLGHIAGEHKTAIQDNANTIVRRNLPVNIVWWTETQLADGLVAAPDTIPPPENGLFRVVEIDGSCCPCGGTHLPRTADVGPIVVRKISRQKGVSRVSYEISRTSE